MKNEFNCKNSLINRQILEKGKFNEDKRYEKSNRKKQGIINLLGSGC